MDPGLLGLDQDGFYVWNDGYWGPEVGFYGGVNYGFGYTGVGYQGGYWHGGAFFYNRAVANFGSVNIVNVYSTPVRVHERSQVSFNGGQGGLRARPSVEERMRHEANGTSPPTAHADAARAAGARHAELHARQNGGRPQILTTAARRRLCPPGSWCRGCIITRGRSRIQWRRSGRSGHAWWPAAAEQ